MAENADGQEKTEDASDKKVRESREKGQVARSKELGTLLITMGSALWFLWLGAQMMQDITSNMVFGLQLERDHAFDMKKAASVIFSQLINALWLITPFVVVMMFIGVVSNIIIGGWNFSTQVWMPKFSKLNPISGIARMFSMNALVELVKALLKFMLMMAIAVLFLYGVLFEIRNLGLMDVNQGLLEAGEHLILAFLVVSLGLIVIAMIDAPYQIWHHNEEMKMTQQEVKDEYKNTEGSPEIKGRIRRMQREMAMRRMMQDVPTANVVITNPEHYAVALKYDIAGGMEAPIVVASGIDFMALQIRTVAQRHEVQIVRSPALARALYYNTEIGQVIPRELFQAVAKILSMIYQLKEKNKSDLPDFTDVEVPANLRQKPLS